MKRSHLLSTIVALALILALAIPAFAQDDTDPALAAVDYLDSIQNADGGFPTGYAPESDLTTTADAIIAFVAAGEDPNAVLSPDMANPYYFLGQQVEAGNVTAAGQVAKVANAVIAGGKDVTAFGGHNLVNDLLALQDESGLFGTGAFDHCLALTALENAGVELPEGAVDAVISAQTEDGGWGFGPDQPADSNTTAICVQALALTDQADAVDAALAYFEAIQNEDGGWPYQSPSDYGTDSDVNSTSVVVQALLAAGEDLADWNTPQDWLLSLQTEEGAFGYQTAMPDANILATIAAIPAVEGVTLTAWAPMPEAE
ncbi:MAG TPA: terpene cyclase/mutase family protein [Aggregatilinea sp.]|uniref:prenyltransferase/squalene oxidase repeat-containing protein n=1 Tax=Aggregatilinea sp. TaxID=2806333 RepID=UPI002BC3BA81|nr:prenyltransferase/squalene oxidase repeat-containing protein [Aggregatilinea sp.]HML20035.1 terpene cyclase/mutase family protein [Aggregatilinea sp.]